VRWEQGRAEIEQLIAAGDMERVHCDREAADLLLQQARSHLGSAVAIADSDAEGAYSLLYDGARKALAAVLENQGLRATSRGGHLAVYSALVAQLDPPMGSTLKPFDRMRRRRNTVEYGARTHNAVTAEEVREDADKAHAILALAERVLDSMSPF
jgi:hypothetical protein